MVPKQRGGSSGRGGGSHGESNFRSVRRGGRPSAGRRKGGCLAVFVLAVPLLMSVTLLAYHVASA